MSNRCATTEFLDTVARFVLRMAHALRQAEFMPYSSTADLPPAVQRILPLHAQDIYREAFNQAHERYADEEIARRVAWAAVKKSYQKLGDQWVRRSGSRLRY